jgi:hypothetical protein
MSDKTPAGVARILKTARAQYTVTSDDITNQTVLIDVPWDVPFLDTNYTCTVSLEGVSLIGLGDPGVQLAFYSITGFLKAADKVQAEVQLGQGVAGSIIAIHAMAHHD